MHGHTNVETVTVSYFKQSLGTSLDCAHPLDLGPIQCKVLTENQASTLIVPFKREEIYSTLNKMKRNKAPGPDGFNVEFFLATWETE